MSIKIRIVSDFDKKGLTEAEKALGSLSNAAGIALAAVGAAMAGIAVKSVQEFAKFDSALTQSQAIMGNLTDAMKKDMAEAAREVAKATTFTAEEAGKSFFYLASAGLDAASSIQALPSVAQFAQAGMFDMAQATDLLTDAQSALGLTIRDDAVANMHNMVKVSDILVRANTLANASVEQFSTSLTTKAGAALRSLGKDTEEGVAVLAAFADQGIKGEEAGTQLSIVLRDLTTKAIKNKSAFAEMGLSVFDSNGEMRNLGDIVANLETVLAGMSDETKKATLLQLGFSDKSLGSMLALLGTSDAIKTYEKELRSATGFTKDVANKQLDTLDAQLKLLQSAFVDVGISIGQELTPYIRDLIPKLQELLPVIGDKLVTAIKKVDWEKLIEQVATFITWIVDNLEGIGRMAQVIGTIAAALVTYTTVARIAATATAILNSTLLLNPFALVAAGLAALTIATTGYRESVEKAIEVRKQQTPLEQAQTKELENLKAKTIQLTQQVKNASGSMKDYWQKELKKTTDRIKEIETASSGSIGEINKFNNLNFSRLRSELNSTKNAFDETFGPNTPWAQAASGFTPRTADQKNGGGNGGGGGGGGQSAADALKEQFKAVQDAVKTAQNGLAKAQKDYNTEIQKIEKDNADAIVKIQDDFAKRLESIVQQSQDRLRNVFKSAVEVNIASLFAQDENKSVEGLVSSLSDRLAKSQGLLSNAADLASAGFSQTFIEQIVSAGVDTGNELAKAILDSSPETQANLQQLFADLEKTANSGMDSLAKQIYEKQGLATEELKNLYVATEGQLVDALFAQQQSYALALETAATTLYDSIAQISKDFDDTISAMEGKIGGLGNTIAALQAKMEALLSMAAGKALDAATMPGGSLTAVDTITGVASAIKNANGIIIDSVNDVAGVYNYLGDRIANAEKYIKSSTTTAAQKASALNTLNALQTAQGNIYSNVKSGSTENLVGTVININVKADTSQSLAMVGKSLGTTVAKYVTGGGQVIVSPV